MIFRTIVRSAERMTNMLPVRAYTEGLFSHADKELDIVTIAFNNVETLRYQYLFLKRNILDSYTYIVADNSTSEQAREDIAAFCREHSVMYVSLPKNFLNHIGGSYSHAMALNYVYRHVLKPRGARYFGYIDHDLFPIQPIRVADYLQGQPIYGPLRARGNAWYLSGIMSFFRQDYVSQQGGVDFMPTQVDGIYLDSGGSNYFRLYRSLHQDAIVFPSECIEPLREGGDRHSDSLEFFDNHRWLHTINGSCWKQVKNGKASLVKKYLETLLSC